LKEFSKITGGACAGHLSFWLAASILVIQVLAFVPWKGQERTPKPQEKRRRRKKKNKRRKKGKKGGLRNTFEHALMWQTESWSLCSRLCGGGEQRRRVSCAMRLTERNITQKVPTSFCRTAGLRRPARVQECGMEGCPAWRKSPWSPCSRAECLSRDTGLRTRTIRCIKGHALVADDLCDSTVRPSSSQPCHNLECSVLLNLWRGHPAPLRVLRVAPGRPGPLRRMRRRVAACRIHNLLWAALQRALARGAQ